MGRRARSFKIRWTGLIAGAATNQVPDVDEDIFLTGAERIRFVFDTRAATTGAPTFDVHIITSNDGTAFEATALETDLFAAQAKNIVAGDVPAAITGRVWRLRLDVNTADLKADEYVEVHVYIDAEDAA
jgi:hypothetical protein